MNRGCYWRFALAVPQTADLVNNVRDSPTASRTIRFQHGRERGHYGSLPGGGAWSVGYERLPRGATTLNGCVKAVCTPSRVYGTFYKVKFFTRSGTAGGVERALKETCRVEASIFARRLKLLNFLPSFTANFAPARKKKVAEGRLGARTPTRTAHCRRQPHGQPHGRQTLNRTILLPTKSPGDPPSIY